MTEIKEAKATSISDYFDILTLSNDFSTHEQMLFEHLIHTICRPSLKVILDQK